MTRELISGFLLSAQLAAFSQALPSPAVSYPNPDAGSGGGAATPASYPTGTGPVIRDGVAVFDGLDAVALPSLLRGRTRFTVAVWFNPTGRGNMRLLGAERGYSLELSESEKTDGRLRWAQFTRQWSAPVYSDDRAESGRWNHAAVVCDGTRLTLFLNGKKQPSANASEGAVTPVEGAKELIGAYTEPTPGKFVGQITGFTLYDAPLSDAQIVRLSEDRSRCRVPPLPAARPYTPVEFYRTDGRIDPLKIVRAYADLLIERGRDTYGLEPSPLFANALDRRNFRIGTFAPITGVRGSDRVTAGANPMRDENLYQILYALSDITGSSSYANAANDALGYFLNRAQHPATGLLAWGEHLGWNFKTEEVLSATERHRTHEFARPWVLWDRCYALNPTACEKYASGLWNHQISDQATGMFSRHAEWDRHGPLTINEYPRHGGFYIATWAFIYGKTQSPELRTAVETLVDMYTRYAAQNPGAIPCCTRPERATMMWPESNLSLAIDLDRSAPSMPPPLDAKMRRLAKAIDTVFLRLKHDFTQDETGFVATADIHTLKPLFNTREWLPYTRPWLTGYGYETDAEMANHCYERYTLAEDDTSRDAYRRLILACADRYLRSTPDLSQPVYPGTFGDVIWHLLNAAEISGEQKYADRAHFFAETAVRAFMSDGIPLPTASSVNSHYEAITRADSLMFALLRLAHNEHPILKNSLLFCDR